MCSHFDNNVNLYFNIQKVLWEIHCYKCYCFYNITLFFLRKVISSCLFNISSKYLLIYLKLPSGGILGCYTWFMIYFSFPSVFSTFSHYPENSLCFSQNFIMISHNCGGIKHISCCVDTDILKIVFYY